MSGASASASASSSSSSLGSSSSSLDGGAVSYAGSGGFSSSTAQASSYTSASYTSMPTVASFELSRLSFSSRSDTKGSIEGSERGAEVSEMLARLTLPARPTPSFQERSQDVAHVNKASGSGTDGLGFAMDSRSASETLGAGRGGRSGAVLAEAIPQKAEAKSSQEKDVRAAERRALPNASVASLEGDNFSASLRQWRGEWHVEPAERSAGENKARGPQTPDDKEERVTQYYLSVLDSLVESNMITEDMASSARGKRGNDLVAAIGVVLSQAEGQRALASRNRRQELELQGIARQRTTSAQAA